MVYLVRLFCLYTGTGSIREVMMVYLSVSWLDRINCSKMRCNSVPLEFSDYWAVALVFLVKPVSWCNGIISCQACVLV